jgi:DNA-binding CsgD family transcriptional regulator
MSQEATTAKMVMELVSTALRAHDEGGSAPETVCAGVASMVGASLAAYVHIDLSRAECHMVCRPFAVETGHEVPAARVTELPWFEKDHDSDSPPRPDGTAEVAEISLCKTATTLRILAVSRETAFTAQEHEILRFAQPLLTVLDVHLQALERLGGPELNASLKARNDGVPSSTHGITDREFEVLTLLAQGLLARGMAARMAISPRTVHKHLGSLYQKLETHDRLTAVTRARRLGLLPPL